MTGPGSSAAYTQQTDEGIRAAYFTREDEIREWQQKSIGSGLDVQ